MSPCAKSGKLDCNHCHTPSGRLRFEGEKSNRMCMPCHEKEVQAGRRARPPQAREQRQRVRRLPHAHDAFCGDGANRSLDAAAHAGHDHRVQVTQCLQPMPRRPRRDLVRSVGAQMVSARLSGRRAPPGGIDRPGAQAAVATPAGHARGTAEKDTDEVYKTSLVRLLRGCDDQAKWPVLAGSLQDPSPLVRSSAASELAGHLTPEVLEALLGGRR